MHNNFIRTFSKQVKFAFLEALRDINLRSRWDYSPNKAIMTTDSITVATDTICNGSVWR